MRGAAVSVQPLLEVRNLTVGYTPDVDIVQDVSLTIPAGAMCGLIGLNGAGKSTLLKAICGFLPPRQGSVLLDGRDLNGVPVHRRPALGLYLIPQESSLFPFMSVEDNLMLVARPRHSNPREALDAVLERFPAIAAKRREKAGNLSGGQQKLVEFAKALIVQPRVLLIDEPSVGLAPKVAREVYDHIAALRSELTMLLVDHNVRMVVHLCDYVYVLSMGKITAEGPRSQFEADVRGQVRAWLGIG